MKLKKATICLLIILLKTFDVVPAMDSYYSSDNGMILPKNFDNLSIKIHWQYVGYYLYKLLYGNDYFSEAAKVRIDKNFGDNQRIISKLNFGEDEPFNNDTVYMLNLSNVSFGNEEVLGGEESTDEAEAQEKQEEDGEHEGSTQGMEAEGTTTEGTTTDRPPPEENPNGTPTAEATMQQTAEGSSDTTSPDDTGSAATESLPDDSQLPATDDVSETVPLYGQMGVQNATFPSGYDSISDPNMPQQQGNALGGYNTGYGENGNAPIYNNMGAQNYDGSYSGFGGQPEYSGQTYNADMGTANYGEMNNSYNNMSDFQQNNQNMGMYPQQQQQGMFQQQAEVENPYNQMNGMSDNQYNQGEMSQGRDDMPQYGQQQIQPYDNSQQQQSDGYPPDYQGQGDTASQSSENMQMQQQQNQMQEYPSEELPSQTDPSGRQFVEEEQSRVDDMENRETESFSEMQSSDENAEEGKTREQNSVQQMFEEETEARETEQEQIFSSHQEASQVSNADKSSLVENQYKSATRKNNFQQKSIIQKMNTPSASLQSQNLAQEKTEFSTQTYQQRQVQPYKTSRSVTTAASWTSEPKKQQPSLIEKTNSTHHNSVFDGAEWNPQRGSSNWGVIDNEEPLNFDPNAPLTSEDF